MIRTIAIAALMGGLMAVPVVAPAQAATMGANCLILPLLQAKCVTAFHDMMAKQHAAVADAMAGHKATAAKAAPKLAILSMRCHRAAAGAGHLFDCA